MISHWFFLSFKQTEVYWFEKSIQNKISEAKKHAKSNATDRKIQKIYWKSVLFTRKLQSWLQL